MGFLVSIFLSSEALFVLHDSVFVPYLACFALIGFFFVASGMPVFRDGSRLDQVELCSKRSGLATLKCGPSLTYYLIGL